MPTKKTTAKKATVKKTTAKKAAPKSDKYFEAVGRRKTSTARVRIFEGVKDKGKILVNDKDFGDYFPTEELEVLARAPFKIVKKAKDFYVTVKVYGGGIKSQAEAIRLGISRALLKYEPDFRATLKGEGFLTRDPRAKERRKFGLKKARKAPQWSKR